MLMKPLHTLVLVIASYCLGITTALADPAEIGIITTLNPERSQWNISIDTRELTLVPGTVIRNLDNPGTGRRGLELRKQVRYRANDKGEITELWVYPSDRKTLRQLGLETNHD
jgi:hypothetical protein